MADADPMVVEHFQLKPGRRKSLSEAMLSQPASPLLGKDSKGSSRRSSLSPGSAGNPGVHQDTSWAFSAGAGSQTSRRGSLLSSSNEQDPFAHFADKLPSRRGSTAEALATSGNRTRSPSGVVSLAKESHKERRRSKRASSIATGLQTPLSPRTASIVPGIGAMRTPDGMAIQPPHGGNQPMRMQLPAAFGANLAAPPAPFSVFSDNNSFAFLEEQEPESLLVQYAYALTPGLLVEPEEDDDYMMASNTSENTSALGNTLGGAESTASTSPFKVTLRPVSPTRTLTPVVPSGSMSPKSNRRRSTVHGRVIEQELTAEQVVSKVSDDAEKVLVFPSPWTQHVVGRHRTYWGTSRRHMLIRGKAHSEVGIQTAVGTRDYIAATKSTLSVLNATEHTARISLYSQERSDFARICEMHVREHQFWDLYVSPSAMLSVSEFSRREAILDLEVQEFDRIFRLMGGQMLVRWAERDRDEAKGRYLAILKDMETARQNDKKMADRVNSIVGTM